MNIHTITDNMKFVQALAPQSVSTGASVATGAGVDTLGYEALLAIVEVGAVTDTTNYSVMALLQQSSDDGSSDAYADISGATTAAISNAGQNEVYLIEINLSECERYIRCDIDGGSAGGGFIGVSFVLFRARRGVPTQQNTVIQAGFERA